MTLVQTRTDSELLRRVQDELEWNPRIESTELTARASHGVVTLSGFVDTNGHREAAVGAVHQLAGVLDVVDDIEVRSRRPAKADEEIAQAVRDVLEWYACVPDEHVRSTVSNGWVTLEGNDEDLEQRLEAERAVDHLLGVRGVTNHLAIDVPAVSEAGIRSSIEQALTRRASREAKHLEIEVHGGVVTLKGTVDSWAERNAVERLAGSTPGVTRIVDEIAVDSYH